jgi:hypothetical protein
MGGVVSIRGQRVPARRRVRVLPGLIAPTEPTCTCKVSVHHNGFGYGSPAPLFCDISLGATLFFFLRSTTLDHICDREESRRVQSSSVPYVSFFLLTVPPLTSCLLKKVTLDAEMATAGAKTPPIGIMTGHNSPRGASGSKTPRKVQWMDTHEEGPEDSTHALDEHGKDVRFLSSNAYSQ